MCNEGCVTSQLVSLQRSVTRSVTNAALLQTPQKSSLPHHMGMGQNLSTGGPQVLVLARVPKWIPIFDPQPHWIRLHGEDFSEAPSGILLIQASERSARKRWAPVRWT